MALSLSSTVRLPYCSPSCLWKLNAKSCKAPTTKLSCAPHTDIKNPLVGLGIGVVTACVMGLTALDADATRIEYYATVAEPLCEYKYVKSGLGYCDIAEGFGDQVPYNELINVSYLLTENTQTCQLVIYFVVLFMNEIYIIHRFTILRDLLMGLSLIAHINVLDLSPCAWVLARYTTF